MISSKELAIGVKPNRSTARNNSSDNSVVQIEMVLLARPTATGSGLHHSNPAPAAARITQPP